MSHLTRQKTVIVVLIWLVSAASFSSGAELTNLRMGFQGIGKVGKWLPIRASASGLPESAEVELQAAFTDPRGDKCVQTVAEGKVGSGGIVNLAGYFSVGRLAGAGVVSFVSSESGEILCETQITHGEDISVSSDNAAVQSSLKLYKLDVPLLLTVGEVAGIEELLRNADLFSVQRPILKGISIASLSDLPDDVRGLESIDQILLCEEFETNDQQAQTLRQWVLFGGDLFVTAAANIAELRESLIGQWLDGYFEFAPEPTSIRELSSLQSFVRGASRLETNRRDVPMAVIRSDQCLVKVNSINGPIIARQSVGSGVVCFVSVDLNQRPLDRWLSLPQLYEVLFFGNKLSKSGGGRTRSSRISQSGISDMATQLMAAVDAKPATGSWSTWSVMALIVVWLLLIGPFDYYLVTQVLKKPHLTWFTFPIFIFAGVAAIVSWSGNNNTTLVNQLSVLDVLADGKIEHRNVRSWMSVSSPQTLKTTLTAEPTAPGSSDTNCSLMWSGRPEDVYGGMYRSGGIGLGRQRYSHRASTPKTLSSIPLLTDGSRQLIAEWHDRSETPLFTAEFSASGLGLLRGSFSHQLPATISDFVIIHGNRVYRTAATNGRLTLEPGQVWDSRSNSVAASDLKAFLNGSKLVKIKTSESNRGSSQLVTPYLLGSQDPQYILTLATFYNVAGGSKYVGLSQNLLRNMELSDTIRLNHAVLIGILDAPMTSLSMDGSQVIADKSTTIVRALLPVRRNASERLAPPSEDSDAASELSPPTNND